MEADQRLTFEGFCLDLSTERLLCAGEVVPLTPKAFAVLRRLIEDDGQLVSKEELLHAGWAKTHVSDGVLKVIILEIRRALGDDSTSPRFIETVPRRGYRFVAPRTRPVPSSGAPDVRSALVGRHALLLQLQRHLERAHGGERQVVFLSGEAGIGKTAVVDAFLATVAGDPEWLLARGSCLEHYGGAEAYLPVLEAFGRLLRQPRAERIIHVLETHAPTWMAQLPWLEQRADREPLRRELLGVTKERMLREMAESLEALTAATPLVLVLEDLHWSDYSTLDMLGMLARRRGAARLLLVGTYRSAEAIATGHPLRALIQELRVRQQCDDIALPFLREAHVAAYLAQRFGGHAFSPALAGAVHQRTDGNPLFMVRVVDELVALRVLESEDDRWRLRRPVDEIGRAVPESLRQLIEVQIARLKPEAQRLLEVASIVGSEFTVVALAAGLEEDALAVDDACEQLARQGQFLAASALFARPDGTQLACYRFTHCLYSTVLADRLSAGRRLRLHQRLGEWLEQTYGTHAGVIETQMARHFEEAQDFRRAIAHLQRAAEQDVRRWAYQEAVTRLERAAALAGRLASAEADVRYPLILDQLARVRRALDDVPGGLRIVDALSTWARKRGHAGWEGRAAIRRASILYWTDPEASHAASMDGLRLSERSDDAVLRAYAERHAAYWQLYLHGCRVADVEKAHEAVTAAAAVGDPDLLLYSSAIVTLVQAARADYRAATRTALDGVEIARDAGDAYMYLWFLYEQSAALTHLGKWGTALTAIDDGLRMAAQIENFDVATLFGSRAAFLHNQACDFAGAAAIARNELRRESLTAGARQSASFELAFAHLGLGELDEAHALFTAPEVVCAPHVGAMPWSARLRVHDGLTQVWRARADPTRARAEADALHALAGSADEPAPRAVGARLLAEIAAHDGQLSEADRRLREAFAAIEDREMPLVEWRTAATAAGVHHRQGDHAAAEAARLRSASLVSELVDSLPPGHPLRTSFVEHPSLRAVLRPRWGFGQLAG